MYSIFSRLSDAVYSIGDVIDYALPLALILLTYAIRWFVFKKAGVAPWKAIIPFFSTYVYYKTVWSGKVYLCLLIGCTGSALLTFIFSMIYLPIGYIIGTILFIAMLGASMLAHAIHSFKVAKSFDCGSVVGLALFFLRDFGAVAVAFGDNTFVGKVDDGIGYIKVLENMGKKKPAPQPAPQPVAQAYDPYMQPVQPQQPVYQPQVVYVQQDMNQTVRNQDV